MREGIIINVLSLFDGISCGRVALERAGIKVDTYYASEVDKYAIQIAQKNYPNTIQIGDVTKVSGLEGIDLLIGGSPCQGFSLAGKKLNFEDHRSKLFFEYVRILKELKPKYFLLENVQMKKEWVDIITEHIKVEPICIDSSLVSAHQRKRLYWTNISNVRQPTNKNITLNDIFDYHEQTKWEQGFDFKYLFKDINGYVKINRKGSMKTNQTKASCLTGGHRGDGNHSDMDLIYYNDGAIRRYSTIECERLQTLPDNYTYGISNTQRYKSLANGWTVDVIAHILSFIRS